MSANKIKNHNKSKESNVIIGDYFEEGGVLTDSRWVLSFQLIVKLLKQDYSLIASLNSWFRIF